MQLITKPLSKAQVFANSVLIDNEYAKAVVDIKKKIIAFDAGMHVDLENFLLEEGSEQKNLWGINLHKDLGEDDFIEFDSMINIRPSQNNRSRGVEDENIQKKIIEIVKSLIINA